MKLTHAWFLLVYFSLSAFAAPVEQQSLNFALKTPSLLQGEIHYSFSVLSPKTIYRDYPLFAEFDSLGLLKKKDASILLSKYSYVVNKPVGFFDEQFSENEILLSYLLGNPTIRRISKNSYLITVPGEPALSYKLQNFIDSDDISTVHHSKAAKAIMAVKKMDVLAQSSSFVLYQETSEFSHAALGGIHIAAYIPLKKDRTLILGYKFVSLQEYANDSALKSNLLSEFESVRTLINKHKQPN